MLERHKGNGGRQRLRDGGRNEVAEDGNNARETIDRVAVWRDR